MKRRHFKCLSNPILVGLIVVLCPEFLFAQLITNQFYPQWAKCFGNTTSYFEEFNDAVLHSNGFIYAVGSTVINGQQDFLLSKIDPNAGEEVFHTNIGFSPASDILHGVAEAPDGSVIAVGVVGGGSTGFPECQYHGNGDIVVVKFNHSDGQIAAIKTIGGSEIDRAYAVVCLSNGDIFVAGKTSSSDFVFTDSMAFGGEDALILKLDINLDLKWFIRNGGSSNDWFKNIYFTSDNHIVSSGSFFCTQSNRAKGFFNKIDTTGKVISTQYYENTSKSYVEFLSIAEDLTTNNLFLIGNYFESSNMATNEGAFIFKTDSYGNHIKSIDKNVFGPGGNVYPVSFLDVLMINNKLYISGEIPMNVRKMGIFVYDDMLNLEYESGYLTVGCNDKPNSILFHNNYFLLSGKTAGSGASDYWNEYTPNATYDAAILKVRYSSITDTPAEHYGEVQVYPNPAYDVLNIDIMNNDTDIFKVTVYSIGGINVISKHFAGKRGQVDINHLPTGIYIAKINFGNNQIVTKFLKQ